MFATHFELTHIYVFIIFVIITYISQPSFGKEELAKGFTATPGSSVKSFQPLLSDSLGNYSFGFVRVDRTQLALGVIHVASQEQVWVAGKSPLAKWSSDVSLLFNGSLVVLDKRAGVLWSSYTDGDRVWLSNTSNLLIESGVRKEILWQSFEFPYNTLMETQNFTSAMTLVSSNGVYSMKLGPDFIGLYAKYDTNSNSNSDSGQNSGQGQGQGQGHLYFQHNPMEAKAQVMKGQGPVRAMVSPDGFLGMYQNVSAPVDVLPFSSFQQPGKGNRRVRLEPDGNLIGYYWARSSWLVDFRLISNQCDLPSSCGPYGLCQPGKGCSCLDKKRDYTSGQCVTGGNKPSGDGFCQKKHDILRRTGVELPNKEIMKYTIMSSLEKCESACEQNCTCWGVVYSNTSGFCYSIDYPIQSIVEVLDVTKMGYFKVRAGHGKDNSTLVGLWVGLGLLCGVVLLLLGVGGVFLYKRESRGVKGYVEEDGVNGGVGPYKNLDASSFKSIELSER